MGFWHMHLKIVKGQTYGVLIGLLCLFLLVTIYIALHLSPQSFTGGTVQLGPRDAVATPAGIQFGPFTNIEEIKQDYSVLFHQYEDVVHLRIIVLTYDRPKSLMRVLSSLQDLELDGDKAVVEIWIDRNRNGSLDEKTHQIARTFLWKKGPVRVHIHNHHVGLYGQWINTWRPRNTTPDFHSDDYIDELALYLEDDTDLSPYGYRWLRSLRKFYADRTDICGYGLQDINAVISRGKGTQQELPHPKDNPVFLYKIPGSWGLAPHPVRWRQFQDWFQEHQSDPDFRPYVEQAALHTGWYKEFEERGTASSMWTMWFIKFCDIHKLYTFYSSLPSFTNREDTHLVYNRRESGLHFSKVSNKNVVHYPLIQKWDNMFADFKQEVKIFDYDGSLIRN